MAYVDVPCPNPNCHGGYVTTVTTTNRPETCPDCKGSGRDANDFSKADARCRGTGQISVEHTTKSEDRCTTCDGKGTVQKIED
jgi:DnaJ-class molecular chaperone